MEIILSIVKKVVVFCLISFIIMELAPKEEYKKYFNLFTGMVLILLMVSPLYQMFTGKYPVTDEFQKYYLKNELKDMEICFEDYDNMRIDAVTGEYRQKIVNHISDIVEKEQMVAEDIQVTLNTDVESEDFLKVMSISFKASKKYREESLKIKEIVMEQQENTESISEITIKNEISQFYNVETDNINIIK